MCFLELKKCRTCGEEKELSKYTIIKRSSKTKGDYILYPLDCITCSNRKYKDKYKKIIKVSDQQHIEINGEIRTISEWSKISGVRYDTLFKRIKNGVCVDELLKKENISRHKDIIGKKYNMLTVVSRAENDRHGTAQWLCQCDCGNDELTKVRTNSLKSGGTKSCGCLWKEANKNRDSKHKHIRQDDSTHRLYEIWCGIKQRCYNQKFKQYKDYGGRGIKVCEEWNTSFENFYNWAISNGYSDDLSIDRENNDLGYSPKNCKWSTSETQNRNKRNSIHITINGIKKLLVEWAEEYGLSASTLRARYYAGLKDNELLVPLKNINKNRNR